MAAPGSWWGGRRALSGSRRGPRARARAPAPAEGAPPAGVGAETLVVVESPAKAVKVRRFLGGRCEVLATKGHLRELARRRGGGVDPDAQFRMRWSEVEKAREPLRAIRAALEGGASRLLLATDPDREGEGISWHLRELLEGEGALEGVEVRRVSFSEVTPAAVREAVAAPRDVDDRLVSAYLARAALDYLVGFTLSPMLWRKLPCARSAGRVQSVALRLVAEREQEMERFQKAEYWDVSARLRAAEVCGGGGGGGGGGGAAPSVASFDARLTHLDGERLKKTSLASGDEAEEARQRVEGAALAVASVGQREVTKRPQAPFKTSTLQRAASNVLGFSAQRTMRLAQELYEGQGAGEGLITYMRTDGLFLAPEAQEDIRAYVRGEYGAEYVPAAPRKFTTKAPRAKSQEAHEAIRPTDLRRLPAELPAAVGADARKLYALVWERTLASQMSSAVYEQISAEVADAEGGVRLRGSETRLLFPGFLRLRDSQAMSGLPCGSGASTPHEDAGLGGLARLAAGQACAVQEASAAQHFTAPPPRFTDGSLVTALEERGIGRPSTYANIIKILVDRGYVRREGRSFHLESQGRVLTSFLCQYFEKYVDYDFTSEMESNLDRVSEGELERVQLLDEFWRPFKDDVDGREGLDARDVQDILDGALGPYLFPAADGSGAEDPALRECGQCDGGGRLGLKLSRSGAFLGCSNYDREDSGKGCNATLPLTAFVRLHAEGGDGTSGEIAREAAAAAAKETAALPRELGMDEISGLAVSVRKGPYGLYLQLGESKAQRGFRRVGLAKGLKAEDITLVEALAELEFPKTLGAHPGDGEPVVVRKGRYGPYLQHGDTTARLDPDEDARPGEIELEAAVVLLEEKGKLRRRGGSKAGKQKGAGKEKTKAKKKAKAKASGKKPRSLSGYNLFCKEAWADLRRAPEGETQPFAEATKQISARWKELGEEAKAGYNERARALRPDEGAPPPDAK